MLRRREFKDYDRLLDQLGAPIYVKNKDHQWVYVNQAFCDLKKKSKDFLLGKSDYDTTPHEQADVFWEKDDMVFKTREQNINIEVTTDGSGSTRWVESKKTYFENKTGEPFIFGTLTDITPLKEREFELEEAWKRAKAAEVAKSAGRIRQVLTNLVGNAVKFTSQGHVFIDVSGKVEGDICELSISVEDTGIGISEEKLSVIFDKFSQADAGTTRQYGGTGLGLNIARDLIHLMGGDIQVSSEINCGSCFSFTLPLPVDHTTVIAPRRRLPKRGAKVLIVDDNATNRKILSEQFKHYGCKSAAVNSAELAMAVLERAHSKGVTFDLIITDYEMPQTDGEALINKIKATELHKSVPIIMLSSIDNVELTQRVAKMGIQYLNKPAREHDLMDAVAYAMGNEDLAPILRPVTRKETDLRPQRVALAKAL